MLPTQDTKADENSVTGAKSIIDNVSANLMRKQVSGRRQIMDVPGRVYLYLIIYILVSQFLFKVSIFYT